MTLSNLSHSSRNQFLKHTTSSPNLLSIEVYNGHQKLKFRLFHLIVAKVKQSYARNAAKRSDHVWNPGPFCQDGFVSSRVNKLYSRQAPRKPMCLEPQTFSCARCLLVRARFTEVYAPEAVTKAGMFGTATCFARGVFFSARVEQLHARWAAQKSDMFRTTAFFFRRDLQVSSRVRHLHAQKLATQSGNVFCTWVTFFGPI